MYFAISDSASTPYSATVKISDIEYGTGEGPSKKVAKLEAGNQCFPLYHMLTVI